MSHPRVLPTIHLPAQLDFINGPSHSRYSLGGEDGVTWFGAQPRDPNHFRAYSAQGSGKGLYALVAKDEAYVFKKGPVSVLRLAPYTQLNGSKFFPGHGRVYVARTLETRGTVVQGLSFAFAHAGWDDRFHMTLGLEGAILLKDWISSPHLIHGAVDYLNNADHGFHFSAVEEDPISASGIGDVREICIKVPGNIFPDVLQIIPPTSTTPTRVLLKRGSLYVELIPGRSFVEYFDGDSGASRFGSHEIRINPWREGMKPVVLGEFIDHGWRGYGCRAPIWEGDREYFGVGDQKWVQNFE